MSVGPEYFAALNLNFLLQIATSLLTYAPQQVSSIHVTFTFTLTVTMISSCKLSLLMINITVDDNASKISL